MIKITHNLDLAIRDLENRSQTQIPRAAVTAMNQCAYKAQQKLRSDFKKTFKSRTPFPIKKILYQKAALSQWPNLHARVGTQFKAMWWQEQGGTKDTSVRQWAGVPIKVKRNDLDTRYKKMPSDLLKKPGYALIRFRSRYFIAYKKPLKKSKRCKATAPESVQPQSQPMQLMYELKKQIHFKPRWNLEKTVHDVLSKLYEKAFKNRMLRF